MFIDEITNTETFYMADIKYEHSCNAAQASQISGLYF